MSEPQNQDEDENGLTPEDLEILAAMTRVVDEAKKRPGYDSVPITTPEKYTGPIGADDRGRVTTYDSVEDLPPKDELIVDEDDPGAN